MIFRYLNSTYKKALTKRLKGSDIETKLPPGGKTGDLIVQLTFLLLGKVAKLDGRVGSDKIEFATSVMKMLDLDQKAKLQAIDFFDLGKLSSTDISPDMEKLAQQLGRRSELGYELLKIQCQSAFIGSSMSLRQRIYLRDVAEAFGYDKAEFQQICDACDDRRIAEVVSYSQRLSAAYNVLQLAPGVKDAEIKRAYRRLVSRHHPDKLNPKNVSDDAVRTAQDQFASIRNAYELLCGTRKIRI